MSQFAASTNESYSAPTWLATVECYKCRMLFAMPHGFQQAARNDPKIYFHCPNGHSQHYTVDSVETKLRNAEAQLTAQRDQLEAAVRDAETVRVALLRDRQRFANGVCPCCNRSFDNVRRHMESKHPDYDPTRVEQVSAVRFACSCGRTFKRLHGLRVHQGSQRGEDWAAPGKSRWAAHLTKV